MYYFLAPLHMVLLNSVKYVKCRDRSTKLNLKEYWGDWQSISAWNVLFYMIDPDWAQSSPDPQPKGQTNYIKHLFVKNTMLPFHCAWLVWKPLAKIASFLSDQSDAYVSHDWIWQPSRLVLTQDIKVRFIYNTSAKHR